MNRIAAALMTLVAASFLIAVPAGAHLKTTSGFYFYGSLYQEQELRTKKDPVNLLFMGGTDEFGSNRVHTGSVGRLLSDWNPKFENNMSKPFDTPKQLGCQASLWLRWRYMPGGETVHEDFQRLATQPGCTRQYHIRGWEDGPHWRNVASHGRRDQFVVAGVHHERLIRRPKGCCVTHRIDRDWDAVRSHAVSALKTRCSYRRWIYHPGADGAYQGFDNTGFLARISLHRVQDGGCDGQ